MSLVLVFDWLNSVLGPMLLFRPSERGRKKNNEAINTAQTGREREQNKLGLQALSFTKNLSTVQARREPNVCQ